MLRKMLSLICMLKVALIADAQQATYWQQFVDYEIHVTLDDTAHTLAAEMTIEYTNNAPESLDFLWMHMWPNAYSDAKETDLAKQFIQQGSKKLLRAGEDEMGSIYDFSFQLDGRALTLEPHPEYADVVKVILPAPLAPGQKVQLFIPFQVHIPSSDFSRLGHSDNAYQITQWYPKPAVYDKNGWNEMPYLNQGEFYSEFGNFSVYITVPDNYIVAASGDLQTASEKAFLMERAAATAEMESFPTDLSFPPSSPTTKTLHYILENAHDFAWFADKRFHVLHGSIELPFSGRTVETWSYFTNLQADLWMKSIDYLNRSVIAYSNYVGEYQWNVAQALEGALSAGAGMEYPTITIIGESPTAAALDNVITHEVGHNWFYGMLGSNEREYAWMDEGINSYYESRYMDTYYNNNPLEVFLGPVANVFSSPEILEKNTTQLSWYLIAGLERMNKSQPIELHSNDFVSLNYGLLVYQKTAFLMSYMADFLGQGQFDRVMARYFDQWKMEHPQPEDIKQVFEEETGEDMSWFFDGLLRDDRSLDYRIQEIQNGKTVMVARIKNLTDIAAPFPISLMHGDSVLRTEWHRGFVGLQAIYINKLGEDEVITELRIGTNGLFPDYNMENNNMRVKGLFKKTEPLALKFLLAPDNPEKTSIFYSPLIGGNVNDGFMLGLGLWNSTFPAPALEWVLAPMYGFNSNAVSGQGSIGWNMYPEEGPFDRLRLSAFGATYRTNPDFDGMWYRKLQPQLELSFRKPKLTDPVSHNIRARAVRIEESSVDPGSPFPEIAYESFTEWFSEVQYTVTNKHILHPYSLTATAQHNRDFLKLFAELNYDIVFSKYKIETRLFAGYMNDMAETPNLRYQYSLAGVSSLNDYLYDDILPGRNAAEGMWSNQITRRDGFFKLPATEQSIGWSNDLLLAFNIELPVPNLPISFFADAGYVGDVDTDLAVEVSGFQYDAGIMLRPINNILEIYFPLIGSAQLADPLAFNYAQYISFTLSFNTINPFEALRKLSL